MCKKDEIAGLLADAHRRLEPSICRIVRLVSDQESEANEPVKLLEVNPATSPSGVFPIAFTADPPDVPYPSVVIEVTEQEFEEIRKGSLSLPTGWRLGETIHPVGV